MSWKSAFYKQAKNDFETFKFLRFHNKEACHQLHYLQMTFEKISKAHLASSDGSRPKPVPSVLLKFIDHLKRNRYYREQLGNSQKQFETVLRKVRPMAQYLEEIVPKANNETSESTEYPWIGINHELIVPCNHHFSSHYQNESVFMPFIQFVERLLQWQP